MNFYKKMKYELEHDIETHNSHESGKPPPAKGLVQFPFSTWTEDIYHNNLYTSSLYKILMMPWMEQNIF